MDYSGFNNCMMGDSYTTPILEEIISAIRDLDKVFLILVISQEY